MKAQKTRAPLSPAGRSPQAKWKEPLPARQTRGVKAKLSQTIEFRLHERTNMSGTGPSEGGRVGERQEHWFLDVEPRDMTATLRTFRKIVEALEEQARAWSAPGGPLGRRVSRRVIR
jgi:hypothetical protein